MKRKDAIRIEKSLKDLGVYKPYVTEDSEMVYHFRCFRKPTWVTRYRWVKVVSFDS